MLLSFFFNVMIYYIITIKSIFKIRTHTARAKIKLSPTGARLATCFFPHPKGMGDVRSLNCGRTGMWFLNPLELDIVIPQDGNLFRNLLNFGQKRCTKKNPEGFVHFRSCKPLNKFFLSISGMAGTCGNRPWPSLAKSSGWSPTVWPTGRS